jgi:hypothetical protein
VVGVVVGAVVGAVVGVVVGVGVGTVVGVVVGAAKVAIIGNPDSFIASSRRNLDPLSLSLPNKLSVTWRGYKNTESRLVIL